MPSPNIVIDARDVTLSLGENSARVDILRGISLSVSAGSSVALLGASGSGKSSLMAVLSGLERASGGSIHVAGADFSAMDEDDLARARRGRIGIVLQAFHGRLGHYPAQLSGGEQQRVAIARAIAPRPALLFADEPTGNLDAATGEAIMDLLFSRQRETSATLIMITHDAALSKRCDRVVTLRDGVIASDSAA
jgi:putative ABC transport system ATP-binding protein